MADNRKIRDLLDVLRDEWGMHDPIAALLRDGPKTIPEIAVALERSSPEVTLWIMAMRRYGLVEETEKAGKEGYFGYKLVESSEEAT